MAKRDFQHVQNPAPAAERLTESELALLADLRRDLEHAQGVFQRFTQGLAAKYKLEPKDGLDVSSGAITRAAKE